MPASLVRSDLPTNKRLPTRKQSPPSSIAGSDIVSIRKESENASLMDSSSPRLEGVPGLVMSATPSATTAQSSTKQQSGNRSSGGSTVLSNPASLRAST